MSQKSKTGRTQPETPGPGGERHSADTAGNGALSNAAPRVARRQFLAWSAGAAATLTLPELLSGCGKSVGGGEQGKESGSGGSEVSIKERPGDASREALAREEGRTEPAPDPADAGTPDAQEMTADAGPDGAEGVTEDSADAGGSEGGPDAQEVTAHEGLPEADAEGGNQERSPEGTTEQGPEAGPPEPISFDPSKFNEDKTTFPYGIQAGAMRENSALLWTFVAGQKTPTLKVWRETSTPGTVVMVYDAPAAPNSDGYLKRIVQGLLPGTWYRYGFFVGNNRSTIGRVRTALAAGTKEVVTVGATSCTRNNHAPFQTLTMTAKEKIDLFLHLGDMTYNDSAQNLTDYRKLWRSVLQSGGYTDLLPTIGYYATWDDHEIDNNFNPETMNAKRLSDAKQAFFETLPIERGPQNRLWNRYRWGDTVEFFVLDCRSERKPSTRTSNDPIYISKAQMKWLKDGLTNSKAHFKVLLNSVPITNMPLIWLTTSDRWEGYKAQREELLNHITNNSIKNVWFLTGDFHVSFVSKVESSGKWSSLREIAVGPGGSNPNPLGATLGGSQFDFGSANTRVMTTLSFDPIANNVHVRFVSAGDNKVLYDKKISQ